MIYQSARDAPYFLLSLVLMHLKYAGKSQVEFIHRERLFDDPKNSHKSQIVGIKSTPASSVEDNGDH